MKSAFALVVLAILLRNSWQISTPQDDSYIAAVLEYEVTSNVTLNIENYEEHIQNAAQQNADIVVFPEMTLTVSTRAVEVPINGLLKTYPIPALNVSLYDEILVHISAAARQNRVYVVVNLQEILNCSNVDTQTFENCPEDKTYLFNTNVVFDRNGAVIDRYRKINLFGEFTRTPALEPDIGIFTTDFGVTFGHFICFDLMFQIPAVQIVEKYNLTDVIFTTMWFSEMPYLTAVQIQEAYAYSMNINFIASGANNVRVGSAGSGIYSGKAGALVSIMPGVPTTRLLVSKVPKIPGQVNFEFPGPIYDNPADHDGLVLIGDPSIPSHISRELVQGFQEFTLVDKEVSCKFTVRLQHGSGDVKYKYRAFVHDGSNTYSNRQLGVAVCSLVACKTDDVKSCPYRFTNAKNHIGFEELQIEMTTYRTQYNTSLKCDNIVYFPQSLTINKFPLDPRNFTYEHITRKKEVTGRTHVIFKINKPQDSVLSFSIWGRLYTKDVNQLKTITNVDVNNYIDLENDIYGIDKRSRRLHYKYRAVAFSGVRSFSGMATGGSRTCAVVACTESNITTCNTRFTEYSANTTGTFEQLKIEAEVPTPVTNLSLGAHDSAFFPLSLRVSIMPLEPEEFTYAETVQQDTTTYTLSLTNSQVELYSFAIWGRFFETDGLDASPPVPGSGFSFGLSKWALVWVFVLSTLILFE